MCKATERWKIIHLVIAMNFVLARNIWQPRNRTFTKACLLNTKSNNNLGSIYASYIPRCISNLINYYFSKYIYEWHKLKLYVKCVIYERFREILHQLWWYDKTEFWHVFLTNFLSFLYSVELVLLWNDPD